MRRSFVALLFSLAVPVSAELTGGIAEDRLILRGVTPAGSVAVFAVLLESAPRLAVRLSEETMVLRDDDADGTVNFDLGRTIVARSIWAAVDLSSGEFVVVTPSEGPRREMILSSPLVKKTAGEDVDELIADRFVVFALWARPGEGAWIVRAADGGSSDRDQKNDGKTMLSTAEFTSVGSGGKKPPNKFKTGDVVIVIDPFEMEFLGARVTP